MEEERIIRPRVLYKPVHGSQDVLLGRLAHRVLLIIRKNDHILSLVTEMLREVCSHVADIVDTAAELAALTKVVDSNEQSFPPAGTIRISEVIVGGCAMTELLGCRRRGLRAWQMFSCCAIVESGSRHRTGRVRTVGPRLVIGLRGLIILLLRRRLLRMQSQLRVQITSDRQQWGSC